MTQQSAAHYLRHGQTPFFRLPVADVASPDAYAGADAILLGVPYDGGATYQPGARLAPYHVRRVSALVQTYHPVHRTDVFAAVRARDGGNVVFPPFDAASVRAAVQGEVARVVAAGAVPFVLGGDHSVALPAMRAVAAAHGPLAVVHVDAH
ncbi:MAG: arginase family protein, partial [Polyangia bacterium]